MGTATRSPHSLFVCDRSQVSLSLPLHGWRNLQKQGWQMSQHGMRLEPQTQSSSFVFPAIVHRVNVRRKSYLLLGFLNPVIWCRPLRKFRPFCCITLHLLKTWGWIFGQINLQRAWVTSARWLTVCGRCSACILNEWNWLPACETKRESEKLVGRNEANKWPKRIHASR